MLYSYKVVTNAGERQEGTIDAVNVDLAIASLQRRGLVITSIAPVEEKGSFLKRFPLFNRVSNRDVVILSQQMSVLFESQVSALRIFRLISAETENPVLQKTLLEVADDIQGGSSISKALAKHPNVFSKFYVNMVRAGEESGKLDDTFVFLAEYLDRTYEITSKARNALIYPAFVIATFVAVMGLMFTVVIPKISTIITDSGQEPPIYTKLVLMVSEFVVNFWFIAIVAIVTFAFFGWRYIQTPAGSLAYSKLKISVPYIGDLYRKLYLSRIADNMHTMLVSGIPMVQALEISAEIVENEIYRNIALEAAEAVKSGSSVSEALSRYPEIPGIMVQMMKVGEETGQLGTILQTLAKFYRREVSNAVDSLVDLIEPVMIVVLGLGVGILLAAVLIPIYNISSSGF